MRNYSAQTLLLAGVAAAGSYVVYCFFDVLGKRYTGHDIPVRQVLPITFVCYAFNLNLSAWVGGIALRYRLYSRLGLRPSQITRVFTLSLLTNWLGYMWLAGLIFVLGGITPPSGWEIGMGALRVLGAALLLACLCTSACAATPSAANGAFAVTTSACRRCAWHWCRWYWAR